MKFLEDNSWKIETYLRNIMKEMKMNSKVKRMFAQLLSKDNKETIVFRKFFEILKNKQITDLEKFTYNRSVGKSKKRPDLIYDCGDYFILIENDEHSHEKYNFYNEKNRIIELFNELYKPIILIRFNCDSSNCNDGNSPFSFMGHILMDKEILTEKITVLVDTFLKYLNYEPQHYIVIEYLFYKPERIIESRVINDMIKFRAQKKQENHKQHEQEKQEKQEY